MPQVNAAVLLKALPPHLRNLVVTRNSGAATANSASAAAARAAFNRQVQNDNLQALLPVPFGTQSLPCSFQSHLDITRPGPAVQQPTCPWYTLVHPFQGLSDMQHVASVALCLHADMHG